MLYTLTGGTEVWVFYAESMQMPNWKTKTTYISQSPHLHTIP